MKLNECKKCKVLVFYMKCAQTNTTYLVVNTKCKSKPLRGASTHLVFDPTPTHHPDLRCKGNVVRIISFVR